MLLSNFRLASINHDLGGWACLGGSLAITLLLLAGCQSPRGLTDDGWRDGAFATRDSSASVPKVVDDAAESRPQLPQSIAAKPIAESDANTTSISSESPSGQVASPTGQVASPTGQVALTAAEADPNSATWVAVTILQTPEQETEQATEAESDSKQEPDPQQAPASQSEPATAEAISTGQITVEELEALAVARHPSLAQFRSQIESARGQRWQAGLPYNPTLQYQSDEIGNDDASGLHSIQLSQQFVTANKLALAQGVQTQEVKQQQALWHRQRLVVRTNVQVAFAKALIAQQRVELSEQIRELADQSVNTVDQLHEAGEVSRVALLQAKVELQQATIAADNATEQLIGAKRQLAAAVSMNELPPGQLVQSDANVLPSQPWDELLAELLATSPEVAAAKSKLLKAQRALHLACAQVTPNVTGTVGVGIDTATDDTYARLGFSVPLPIRNRNEGNIHTARAEIAAANAAITRTEYDLTRRLSGAVARYQVARQRHEQLQETVLPLANETLELSLEAFRGGETSYLELLTAQRSLFSTRLSVLEALAQARQALAEINGQLVTINEAS